MARRLSSYNIETDTTVHLQFSDGTTTRTELNQLGKMLNHDDLATVSEGVHRRRRYLERNLGSLAKYIAIGLLVVIASYDTTRTAQIVVRHFHHAAVPSLSAPAHQQNHTSPSTSHPSVAPASNSVQPTASQPSTPAVSTTLPTTIQSTANAVAPITPIIDQATGLVQTTVNTTAQVATQTVNSVLAPVSQLVAPLGITQPIQLP